jgi:hypothetical protein
MILLMVSFFMKIQEAKTPAKRTTQQVEKDFSPEAKAVLFAIRTAKAELEQSKLEFITMINDAKASIAAGNLTPVHTTWVDHSRQNAWVCRTQNRNVFALLGFRDDGLVVWKFEDVP